MRLHRFIGDYNLDEEFIRISDREVLNQILKVFRFDVGKEFILCDGNENEAIVRITKIIKGMIEVEVTKKIRNNNELKNFVTLFCSLLKRSNFELVVQKATEVGVSAIVPIITKRTVKQKVRLDRLEKIAKEAAEQSSRGKVPSVHSVIDFGRSVEEVKRFSSNLFFDASGKEWNYMERFENPKSVAIWIGPEGGWEMEEIEIARKNKFEIVSLGKLTLRAETAAIVASYLACKLS